jgi:hypothetical protein
MNLLLSFVVAIYVAHHVDGSIMGLKAEWWSLIMFMIENCEYIYIYITYPT